MPVVRTERTPQPLHSPDQGRMPSRRLLTYGAQVRGMLQMQPLGRLQHHL